MGQYSAPIYRSYTHTPTYIIYIYCIHCGTAEWGRYTVVEVGRNRAVTVAYYSRVFWLKLYYDSHNNNNSHTVDVSFLIYYRVLFSRQSHCVAMITNAMTITIIIMKIIIIICWLCCDFSRCQWHVVPPPEAQRLYATTTC